MLKRLQIRNFRGFNALKIDDLGGINLIAGKNNSGKTSLLEAIFLLAGAGNVQMAINRNVIRGLESEENVKQDPFWKQLFFNLNMRRSIEIKGFRTSRAQLILEISSKRRPIDEIPVDSTNGSSATNLVDERALVFKYTGPRGKLVKGHIRMGEKDWNWEVEQPTVDIPFHAIILLSRIRNIREDAKRLAKVRQRKEGDMLLKALRIFEPRLRSLEENSSSGAPMIWGDIGLPELVPLPVMGDGMTQIARLVLAIASVPDGVVMIDEVENGIHHSVLGDVWQVIDEAANQFRTQVFATTHSIECVTAAHESLSTDRFRLHRLEISDNANRCVTYEPDAIDAAIRHNLEVR